MHNNPGIGNKFTLRPQLADAHTRTHTDHDIQYSTVQYSTVQYSTVQYSKVQYSKVK